MPPSAPLQPGPFILAHQVGSGSASEVWQTRAADGEAVALELLTPARARDRRIVWFGSSTGPDDELRVRASDAAAEDRFGAAVALLPDLKNGDAYDDLAVGAPGRDPKVANAGGAWVCCGGAAGVDDGQRVLAPIPLNSDQFGEALALVVDATGDGLDELPVGVHQDDDPANNGGTGHIFRGQAGGGSDTSISVYTAPDGGDDDSLGVALASLGDLDGDGFGEVLVGGSGAAVDGIAGGASWVFHGNGTTGLHRDRTMTLVGSDTSGADRFGRSVASAGDTNGLRQARQMRPQRSCPLRRVREGCGLRCTSARGGAAASRRSWAWPSPSLATVAGAVERVAAAGRAGAARRGAGHPPATWSPTGATTCVDRPRQASTQGDTPRLPTAGHRPYVAVAFRARPTRPQTPAPPAPSTHATPRVPRL